MTTICLNVHHSDEVVHIEWDAMIILPDDKARVIRRIQANPGEYCELSQPYRADKDILMAALAKSPCMFEFATPQLQANVDVIVKIGCTHPNSLKYADQAVLDKEAVILRILDAFSKDMAGTNTEPYSFPSGEVKLAGPRLLRGADFFRHASLRLRSDKNFVLSIVSRHGFSLRYVADHLRADKDVVLAAMRNDPHWFQAVDATLRADLDFVLPIVKSYPPAYAFLPEELRSNEEVVLAAVRDNWDAPRHFPQDVWLNRELLKRLVKVNGCVYNGTCLSILGNDNDTRSYAIDALTSLVRDLEALPQRMTHDPFLLSTHFMLVFDNAFLKRDIPVPGDLVERIDAMITAVVASKCDRDGFLKMNLEGAEYALHHQQSKYIVPVGDEQW